MSIQAKEIVRRAVTVLLCGRTAREEASFSSSNIQNSVTGAPLPAVPLSELSARMQNIPSPPHPPIAHGTEEQNIDYAIVQSVAEQAVRQVRTSSSAASQGRPRAVGETISQKFWQDGSLGYGEVVTDGFYDIHGDYPEVCEGTNDFPSLADLRKVRTSEGDVREVVVVDHENDNGLLGVEETLSEAMGEANPQDTVARIQVLANVVAERFGGVFDSERTLELLWRGNSATERRRNRSVVLLVCSLEVGAARHRALLFKVLADALKLPCKLVRGQALCGSDNAADAFVVVDGAEYVVDLVMNPGRLLTPEQYALRVHQRRTASDSLQRATSNVEQSAASPSSNATQESSAGGGYPGAGGTAITPTTSAPLPSGPSCSAVASPAEPLAPPMHNSPRAVQFRPAPLAPPVPPPVVFGNPMTTTGGTLHGHGASRFLGLGQGTGSGSGPAIAGSRIRFTIADPVEASNQATAGRSTLAPVAAVAPPARLPASSGGGIGKQLTAPPVREASTSSGMAGHSGRQGHGAMPSKAHSMNDLGGASASQGSITPTGSGAGDLIRFDSGSLADNPALGGLDPGAALSPQTPSATPTGPAPSSQPPQASQPPRAPGGACHFRQESFDQNGWVKFGGSFGRAVEDIQAGLHGAGGAGPSPLGQPPLHGAGVGGVAGGPAVHSPQSQGHGMIMTSDGGRSSGSGAATSSGGLPPVPHNGATSAASSNTPFQRSSPFAAAQLPGCGAGAGPSGVGGNSWSVVVSGAGNTSTPGSHAPQPRNVAASAFCAPARAGLQGLAASFPELPPPLLQQAPGPSMPVGQPAAAVAGPLPVPGYPAQPHAQTQAPIRMQQNTVLAIPGGGNGRGFAGVGAAGVQAALQPKPADCGVGNKAPSPPLPSGHTGGDGDLFRDLSPFVSQLTRTTATSSGSQQPEGPPVQTLGGGPSREQTPRVPSLNLPQEPLLPLPQPPQQPPAPVVEQAPQYQDISPDDLTLHKRIGGGSYGTVYRGTWRGTEVAVKLLGEQNLDEGRIREFQAEVTIMNRLRHPNIVLFMGAVTTGEQLAIVTEFVPRGSLFRLLHDPNVPLDARRRLNMARDIAKGMEYLHSLRPPVVHRDLKSPNLLVDRQWTVKVCDFGLSRTMSNTYLTAGTQAGTAEWMAPEVLRNELCDEKCDVFSFGVIMYELVTGRKPWEGLNVGQVVAEVAFKHRRLTVPKNVDPAVKTLIESCWANDPRDRPSFSHILALMTAWTELRLVSADT